MMKLFLLIIAIFFANITNAIKIGMGMPGLSKDYKENFYRRGSLEVYWNGGSYHKNLEKQLPTTNFELPPDVYDKEPKMTLRYWFDSKQLKTDLFDVNRNKDYVIAGLSEDACQRENLEGPPCKNFENRNPTMFNEKSCVEFGGFLSKDLCIIEE